LLFDESWYLERYPDVLAAVTSGLTPSALVHYVDHGKGEGRLGYRFEKDWYINSYPLVEREIRVGRAADARSHYETIGQFRGYLPHRKAPRPANPVAPNSLFGGFWTDQTDSVDRINGKLEIGLITQIQSEQLLSFSREGFVIIEKAISEDLLASTRHDLDKAYLGGFPDLLFECPDISDKHINWNPRMIELSAKGIDIHWFSAATRSLLFAPKILSFLQALFESHALVSHSVGILRGFDETVHQDSAEVGFTLQRSFVASRIALEDLDEETGEFSYFPGSHRLDDFLYAGHCKSIDEANRVGISKDKISAESKMRVQELLTRCHASRLVEQRFLARAGDVFISHSDLVIRSIYNGTTALSTSKAVLACHAPRKIVPSYFETHKTCIHDHIGLGYYASSQYGHNDTF
jgi:hypothetical protein